MAAIKEVFKKVTASGGVTNTICDFIIRPPRSTRTTADLGPTPFRMGSDSTGSSLFIRQDFELENMRGMMMKCSWFKPQSSSSRLPCVVYCHANCGSRYDSLEVLFLLNHGFTVFSLDFSGSGQSEGEFISLGYYERQDLAVVVDYLQSKPKEVDTISLWGRSMGAVTSIMYAAKDPSIKCVVADSPFSSLHRLIHELVNTYGGNSAKFIPNVVIDGIIGRMKNRIAERASFDLDDLDTTKYARECVVPTFIIHGAQDDFVVPNHSLIISNNFKGMCLRTLVEGGHNDGRSDETEATALSFLRVYAVEKPKAERDRAAAEMAKRVSSLPQAPVSPPLHPAPASQGPPRVASSMPSDVAISGSEHLTAGDLYLDPTNLSSISALPISFRTPTLQPAEP